MNNTNLTNEIINRPSWASAHELKKYKARFALDRSTQILNEEETNLFKKGLSGNKEIYENWNNWRSQLGRAAIRTLTIVDHHRRSYNYWVTHELPKQVESMKPFIISAANRVHVFKITECFICSPLVSVSSTSAAGLLSNTNLQMLATGSNLMDFTEPQLSYLSPHEAAISNTAYEGTILVNVAQWTYTNPSSNNNNNRDYNHNNNQNNQNNGGKKIPGLRFKIPDGWQTWKLESEELHKRKPLHRFGCLMMSILDKRSNGLLKPSVFAYEDFLDQGGYLLCANSSVILPLPETLAHNQFFTFPVTTSNSNSNGGGGGDGDKFNNSSSSGGNGGGGGGASQAILTANDGFEQVDENEPFEIREAKALLGLRIHMHKAHKMEIRCIPAIRREKSTSTIILRKSPYSKIAGQLGGQQILVQMQFVTGTWSPTILFLALGFSIDQGFAMIKKIAGPHWYPKAFDLLLQKMRARHPPKVNTQNDACIYIANRTDKSKYTADKKLHHGKNEVVRVQFMPQSGLSLKYNPEKAWVLAEGLFLLALRSCGYAFFDNKDRYYLQRYDSVGILMGSLERQLLTQKIYVGADRILRSALQHHLPLNFPLIFNEQKNSDQMASCINRGSWSVHRNSGAGRTGVTLQAKNTNFFTYASGIRRVNTANKSHRRSIQQRLIDEGQYSRLCSTESPEGEMMGIARFKAIGSTLSIVSFRKVLMALIYQYLPANHYIKTADYHSVLTSKNEFQYWLNCDGTMELALTKTGALLLVQYIRLWRRKQIISPHISVCLEQYNIILKSAPGRNVRLLIVLKPFLQWLLTMSDGNGMVDFHDALHLGIIEYIDAVEERSLSVAYSFDDLVTRPEFFSHMEVDPSWMLGITAGSLPYVDHNQSARSVLCCAMAKQTFSGIINPFKLYNSSYILDYPMRAITRTRLFDDLRLNHVLGMGHEVDILVCCSDHAQEDSTEFNLGSLERGAHRTFLQKRYFTNNKNVINGSFIFGTHYSSQFYSNNNTNNNNNPHNKNSSQKIVVLDLPPVDAICRQDANYNKLTASTGMPKPGTMIQPEDMLIAKYSVDLSDPAKPKRDESISAREERGVVQSTRTIVSENGALITKEVILRNQCLNEIGDKYFCWHGQKGTTGIVRPEDDMYFSIVTGKPATVIFSPIGGLGRNTDGLFLEIMEGVASAVVGEYSKATAFLNKHEKMIQLNIIATLLKAGAQRLCYETHINGVTGQMTKPLLRGVIHMSPLAHLVGGKLHARNRGPTTQQARQPTNGRASDGGLRLGQMETDNLIGLGSASTLNERLQISSDEMICASCIQCGSIATYAQEMGIGFCRLCWSSRHLRLLPTSTANKLCFQEFNALHIRPKLILEDSINNNNNNNNNNNKITTRYQLLQIPQPEKFEFEELGVTNPLTLPDRVEVLAEQFQQLEISLQNQNNNNSSSSKKKK